MNDFAFFRASKSLQVGFIPRTMARLIVPYDAATKGEILRAAATNGTIIRTYILYTFLISVKSAIFFFLLVILRHPNLIPEVGSILTPLPNPICLKA
jgi:hypothetical protein